MADTMQGYLKDYLDSSMLFWVERIILTRGGELAKEYVETDPRYQSRIDGFA
ncbi:MAG: hypothetical protein HYU39_09315 [Thaumarchaeota archaeon]|nr:hypothetical protein [Nitrososphaerota archaeon]